jgi:Flp pilus assembly pilin Flp
MQYLQSESSAAAAEFGTLSNTLVKKSKTGKEYKLLSVDTNGETQAPLFEKLKNLNDSQKLLGTAMQYLQSESSAAAAEFGTLSNTLVSLDWLGWRLLITGGAGDEARLQGLQVLLGGFARLLCQYLQSESSAAAAEFGTLSNTLVSLDGGRRPSVGKQHERTAGMVGLEAAYHGWSRR